MDVLEIQDDVEDEEEIDEDEADKD
jgi:hypothetical protein